MRKLFITLGLLLILSLAAYAQIDRIGFRGGYTLVNWHADDEELVLNDGWQSGFTAGFFAPVLSFWEDRFTIDLETRIMHKSAKFISWYFEDTEMKYIHEVDYYSLDVPVYLTYHLALDRSHYRYSSRVINNAILFRIGINPSFSLSSNRKITHFNGSIAEEGAAFSDYSPKLFDIIHQVNVGIGYEHYFMDKLGVRMDVEYLSASFMAKTINHPVMDKRIYYSPNETAFSERIACFSAGLIYKF